MLKTLSFLFLYAFIQTTALFSENVGLLIVATGKYIQFVKPLVESAEKYFCKKHNVTYFVFTDQYLEPADNIVRIEQNRLGWPYDTLMRSHIYYLNKHRFIDQDYLFACDADMLFAGDVGDEIFGDHVATLHPGFYNSRGTYEKNPLSTACVKSDEGKHYFAGGFYGGSREVFFDILLSIVENINEDLRKNFIAVWHDESHWNRYCIDHEPTVILSPSYCYPENWKLPFEKKLLALDKNHKEMRDNS